MIDLILRFICIFLFLGFIGFCMLMIYTALIVHKNDIKLKFKNGKLFCNFKP